MDVIGRRRQVDQQAFRISALVKKGVFGRSTLYALIKQGKLRARRLNGIVFVMSDDYQALLDSASPIAAQTNHP